MEKRDDPLAGDLPGEMQRQDKAMQIGAISPDNPRIEFGDDRLALRRLPAFPPIARHLRAQAQVLNHDLLVALVARAGRRLRPHNDGRINRQLVQLAAAPTPRLLALGALAVVSRPASIRRFVHAGRLLWWTRRQIFQPRKLILNRLCSVFSFVKAPLSFSFSARRRPTSPINSRTTPISSVCVRRSSESGRRDVIPSLNHIFESLTPPARKFAPVTRQHPGYVKHGLARSMATEIG